MRRLVAVLMGCGAVAYAQFGRGAGDWVTSGSDAQRSSWIRSDSKISKDSLSKPGFQFLWTVKLASDPKQSNSLTEPVLLDRYIGYRGFRSLGFMGNGSNGVAGVDTDLARVEWRKQLGPPPAASTGCMEGFVAEVTRPTTAEIQSAGGAQQGFGGRGGAARSGVGLPLEGAVTLTAQAPQRPARPPQPNRPGGPGGPGFRPGARPAIVLYALSSDGMFHTMYVSNGEEPAPPVKFLPPNTASHGLIVLDNVAYTAVLEGCGASSGVWALDLDGKQVTNWTEAGLAGSAGAAVGPDETLYVATAANASNYSSSVVALDSKTLKPKDWYKARQAFTSSPVIFQYKNKVLLAAATKDGSVHLLDTASLGGSDHQTPLHRTTAGAGDFAPGTLATWQDRAGVRWLLARANGAIAAWKLTDQNGGPVLQPGWKSRDMVSPEAPLIVNGVVFALSSGSGSQRAVLYAMDAETGKELWNSGDAIASAVRGAGLSAGGGQVYVTAQDGTMYAFGFWMEH